jgi:hypothetical protein
MDYHLFDDDQEEPAAQGGPGGLSNDIRSHQPPRRMNNVQTEPRQAKGHTGAGQILQVMLEGTVNGERVRNKEEIRSELMDNIKLMAVKERNIRRSTITIKAKELVRAESEGTESGTTCQNRDNLQPSNLSSSSSSNSNDDILKRPIKSFADIKSAIIKDWNIRQGKMEQIWWTDSDNIYCQFRDHETKTEFLDYAISAQNNLKKVSRYVQQANDREENYRRKTTRIIIHNVRTIVKDERLKEILAKIMEHSKGHMEDFRSGKIIRQREVRTISFRVDSEGFMGLFAQTEGVVPYIDNENGNNIDIKLKMTINVRPYQCNQCFEFGNHLCKGRSCGRCGRNGHLMSNCSKIPDSAPTARVMATKQKTPIAQDTLLR